MSNPISQKENCWPHNHTYVAAKQSLIESRYRDNKVIVRRGEKSCHQKDTYAMKLVKNKKNDRTISVLYFRGNLQPCPTLCE